jgi:hypothetical protein
MLLIFLSSSLFSASNAASLLVRVPALAPVVPETDLPFTPPDELPPEFEDLEAELPAVPAEEEDDPVEFAVPNAFVPGAVGTFAEFPTPLGSFTELFRPPALAGPLGTPLTPAVPAPAEPAFGEPAAEPVPAVGPLAAPAAEPAEEPPADPPPPEPPPEPPPLPCASTPKGTRHVVRINI